jgi:signal transduction histidine kinase
VLNIFFFSCNKGKDVALLNKNKNIDTLFTKANNSVFDKKIRLEYANRVFEIIKGQENDSITRQNYYKLADVYYNLGNFEKSNQLYREMSLKSEQANDIYGIAKSNYCIGYNYFYSFNNDSAYYYYTKSEKAYKKLKDYTYLGSIINTKSTILFLQNDFVNSEKLAINALILAKKNKNYTLVYNCFLTLGNNLEALKNNEKAIEYYKKAYQTAEYLKDNQLFSTFKAQPYNYIGKIYQKKGDYKKSIFYFTQGLRFGDFKNTDPGMYCYLTNNLAFSQLQLGDKSSVKQFEKVLKIADSIHNIPAQITSKINLSQYYLTYKDSLQALQFAQQARQQAYENKIFEDQLKCLQLLAKTDPANSIVYTDRFIKLTDSLQNMERATRDKYARIEFETDEIIKEKDHVVSERDYISFQRWMILGIGLLIILVLSLWYVYTSQKNKNKELQLIQEQQRQNEEIYHLMLDQHQKLEEGKQLEKKRISQDLHDGVMGKLSGIRLNLYALSKKTDHETIAKCLAQIPEIQNVEKEIRIIAHNLSTNLFSDNANFTQMVKNLFSNLENHDTIHFVFDVDEKIVWENINSNVKINIYRIIQEALHNISKYAQAKNVSLIMLKSTRGMAITISDDGKGFDAALVKTGIGLKNMKNRIEALGGQFGIQSQTNIGTKINFTIPI